MTSSERFPYDLSSSKMVEWKEHFLKLSLSCHRKTLGNSSAEKAGQAKETGSIAIITLGRSFPPSTFVKPRHVFHVRTPFRGGKPETFHTDHAVRIIKRSVPDVLKKS